MSHHGFKLMRSALSILLGSGAALGGSYIFSRIKETQETETRLTRLEHLLSELVEVEKEKKKKPKSKAK